MLDHYCKCGRMKAVECECQRCGDTGGRKTCTACNGKYRVHEVGNLKTKRRRKRR